MVAVPWLDHGSSALSTLPQRVRASSVIAGTADRSITKNEISYTIKKRQMVVEAGEEGLTMAKLLYSMAA